MNGSSRCRCCRPTGAAIGTRGPLSLVAPVLPKQGPWSPTRAFFLREGTWHASSETSPRRSATPRWWSWPGWPRPGGARVVAKVESFNPLSSVKDRIGLAMVEAAEREGRLAPGATLVEPTSGNTGIALAFVCAAKGYRLVLTMPETASVERRRLMSLLGAELVLTPGPEGMAGAIARAEQIVAASAGALMLQQFRNPANPEVHRRTTAEEIWADTDGLVDIFVGGVGTGGTITGVGQVLKARRPVGAGGRRRAGRLAGALGRGQGPAQDPGHRGRLRPRGARPLRSSTRSCRWPTRTPSAPPGCWPAPRASPAASPAGAALHAALQVAARPENAGKLLVVLLPDTAERYLSTALVEEPEEGPKP